MVAKLDFFREFTESEVAEESSKRVEKKAPMHKRTKKNIARDDLATVFLASNLESQIFSAECLYCPDPFSTLCTCSLIVYLQCLVLVGPK